MDAECFTPERELGQRHKRSHAEMSVTLSPSPITFRGPSTSTFARYSSAAAAAAAPLNNNFFPDRRRTSHPHNPPQPSQSAAGEMSQQGQLHPRLEHRASQTIIDLTEAGDDVPLNSLLRRDRAPSHLPPQLGRSDSQRLDFQVIDLTEDDADVQITGARNRNRELPTPHPHFPRPPPDFQYPPRPARPDSPGLFVPLDPVQHHQHVNQPFPQAGDFGDGNFEAILFGNRALDNQAQVEHLMRSVRMQGLHVHGLNVQQLMPRGLDYRHPAFGERKPDHVAPEPAKAGFTRSPKDEDTVICPSCEEELVHDKDVDEPLSKKKNGKTLTKKDREEHPFWVVKDCGHVYCNYCYQNRHLTPKRPANVSFPERKATGNSKTKGVMCAVEGCESDVKDKTKWLGVFL